MVNRVRGIRNHPFRAALACIMKRRQRVSALETAMERIKTRMAKRAQLAAVCALLLAAADADQEPRRAVRRAAGKWRGSTIQGYVVHGDEQTYLENFRCSRVRLQQLVERMSQSPMQRADPPTLRTTRGRSRRILVAARVRDAPDLTFKVAMCLYALGQGGPVKVLADAGSIGRSTLRTWLEMFCDAVTKYVKPIYMPCKPFDGEQLRAVQSQFASRRGLRPVTLACDGSHIPFHPKSKKVCNDYRNYKGWFSILAVAFVDSYYRFFDVDVGFPGRAGDNTVLKHNWLMEAMKQDPDTWLGKGGVILGDSGAGDGGSVFMNPYHSPDRSQPERLYFNFCHSSTRFYVEQARVPVTRYPL